MKIKFGTDGVRGKYPEVVNEQVAFNLALALSKLKYKKVIIGMDTRSSSESLFRALVAGFNKTNIKVYFVGVCSTPALAYLCNLKKRLGVMITASHNDYSYNGLKVFFGRQKVNSEQQEKIEQLYKDNEYIAEENLQYKTLTLDSYFKSLCSINCCSDLKIAFDLANGGMSNIDYSIFKLKNLNIIANNYDGVNINKDVGVMYPMHIVEYVRKNSFDMGVSFDGDGDRIMICDSGGNLYDGDQILYILANYYFCLNAKKYSSIVVTEATNMGLIKSLEDIGIRCLVSGVGDHNVYQMMLENKVLLGGETVGHIINRTYSQSGDGLLVALLIIKIMHETHKSLSELVSGLNLYYQKKENLNLEKVDESIFSKIRIFNADHYPSTRILLRKSGTENIYRLLVESENKAFATKTFNKIKKAILEKKQ